jgi:hypothetical protein
VEPRIVDAGDERRLAGYAALPYNLNPYLRGFGDPVLAAGVILPAAGSYDIVFDSRSASRAGAFSFRYWLNDVTPPSVKLSAARVTRGRPLTVTTSDAGSGVDGSSLVIAIDGADRGGNYRAGRILIPTTGLRPGQHQLRLQISDYQETRNMENVAKILPNTRVLTATFTVAG